MVEGAKVIGSPTGIRCMFFYGLERCLEGAPEVSRESTMSIVPRLLDKSVSSSGILCQVFQIVHVWLRW